MTNRRKIKERLKELIEGIEEAKAQPIESKQGTENLDANWSSESIQSPKSDEPRSGKTQRIKNEWRAFLDGVDRGEKIGFAYERQKIIPLAKPIIHTEKNDLKQGKDDAFILTIPIQIGQESLGILKLERPENPWSQQEASLVSSITQRAAQHLDSLRLLAQTEKYRQEAETAARRLTIEGWRSYFAFKHKSFIGYEYDLQHVLPLEVTPETEPNIWTHPLALRGAKLGLLQFSGIDHISTQSKQLVETVAERLSTHIENLRLTEQTQKSALELQTVADVSIATSTLLDPKQLLKQVTDLTKSGFGLYHAHIYLIDPSGKKLELAAGAGEIGQQMVAEGWVIFVDEESIVARCARTRSSIIVKDVRIEPDFLPNPLLPETLSELAIPMIVGQKLLGVFDVQSRYSNAFTENDLRIYTTLATQTAVAYQNAILFQEQLATVERLRELDQLKTAFLANMSHELRTPLNSIIGFTQVIAEGLDGPLTEEMANDLSLIEKNGQHLLKLINDILDMAKIEAGRMSLIFGEVNLYDIWADVLEVSTPLAREKSLTLNLEADLPRPRFQIVGDQVRLRQVFLNLISNAIKFTPEGSITVCLSRVASEIRIEVKDTGIGIPPDKLETVFEAFSQVDSSTTRKVGGTGLGLPISRRLIELHHGRLWAESSGIPGEGTTFIIELPVTQPADS